MVLATDNEPSRYAINDMCVRNRVPFVVGRVFTRGIGGEVFAYRPPTKAFNLKLSFSKSRASREDVIDALEAIIKELRKAK